MAKNYLIENLEKVENENNIYTMLLFALANIKKDSNYSVIGDMMMTFDRDTVLKMCQYYGGLKITLPTLEELQTLLYAMICVRYTKIDGMTLEEAITKLSHTIDCYPIKIKEAYYDLIKVLEEYDFQ